jgi:hypothetical protein
MAKKCIPGVFCIENMTLFILFFMFLISLFFIFIMFRSEKKIHNTANRISLTETPPVLPPSLPLIGLAKTDVFSDPYFPPVQDNTGIGVYYPRNFTDVRGSIPRRGVPINIETQPTGSSFNQVGILTRAGNKNGELILPLFGRNLLTNRDKWQYYTLSNTGNISSKLPVIVHKKNGMSEYGVDEIYGGDVIYVQGYNDIFLATIYENRGISYIPYL